jgi:predicted ABC-class ATPase
VKEEIDLLLHALGDAAGQVPDRIIEHEWLASLDQKLLRDLLPERGLVCFIGDGTRPARGITWHRSFYRVAGPKPGVNIPFRCPRELDPVEITHPASGETVTGLGIREREVFAIIGA